jgi:glycosyltransferase involved in cell wall biosynthesis
MSAKVLILFLETYDAGGQDSVSRILFQNLKVSKIHVFVNKRNDNRILKLSKVHDSVTVHRYSLLGTSELSDIAYKINNKQIRFLLRLINIIIKYPLIFISIPYFYFKFKHLNPDVVMSINGGYPAAEYCRSSVLAATFLNNTNIFMVFFNKAAPSKRIFSYLEKVYDKFLDNRVTFICDSYENAKNLNIYRNFRQKVITIHNGQKVKKITHGEGISRKFKMLNVAGFEDRKNQLMLVSVIHKLVLNGNFDIELTLIGHEMESGYLKKVEKKIQNLKLEKYIRIVGYTESLKNFYENSHVFLLSSKGESLPVVVTEAASYELPIIATKVGGLSEQVRSNYNGFLVESGNILDMVDKVCFFIDHPTQREVMGKNSHNYFLKKFTVKKMISNYNQTLGLSK